jgi:hypothetical protein
MPHHPARPHHQSRSFFVFFVYDGERGVEFVAVWFVSFYLLALERLLSC